VAREYGKSFKDDVRLDKNDLPGEAEYQSSLLQSANDQLADAKTEKSRLEVLLKYTEATASLNYRKNPPEGVKITEEVVKSLVATDAEVVKVQNELVSAIGEVNAYAGAVDTIKEKGDMIKIETSLLIGGFFAVTTGTKKAKDYTVD
jgi:hypothetical protein